MGTNKKITSNCQLWWLLVSVFVLILYQPTLNRSRKTDKVFRSENEHKPA